MHWSIKTTTEVVYKTTILHTAVHDRLNSRSRRSPLLCPCVPHRIWARRHKKFGLPVEHFRGHAPPNRARQRWINMRQGTTHGMVISPYVNHDEIFPTEFRIPDEIRDLPALQAAYG